MAELIILRPLESQKWWITFLWILWKTISILRMKEGSVWSTTYLCGIRTAHCYRIRHPVQTPPLITLWQEKRSSKWATWEYCAIGLEGDPIKAEVLCLMKGTYCMHCRCIQEYHTTTTTLDKPQSVQVGTQRPCPADTCPGVIPEGPPCPCQVVVV